MKNTSKNTVKPSEIVCHGRDFPYGMTVFSCYSRELGSFRTDETGKAAKAAALAYFNRKARK